MAFLDKVKRAFRFEKKDDVKSHNNNDINNKDGLSEDKEEKEIQPIPSEESVLKDKEIDGHAVIRNFRYLDKLIHGERKEIVLDSDIVLDSNEESQYMEGIKLDVDDLVIDGNGHTIDAQGLTRIFYCTGKNVIIKNIILKNGVGWGGAIKNRGSLIILNSTLNNNTSEWYGGAIYNDEGCSLTIAKSTLNNNRSEHRGGAIYNTKGKLTITESTLNGNTAIIDGGAISNSGNSGELTITESTLNNNTAIIGGAIHGGSGKITIIHSKLTGNTVRDIGGAIYNMAELSIHDSLLNNNASDEDGGAIFNYDGEITITESTLNGNTAKEDGGAIHNERGNFKISNCEFSNNKSPNNIILNNDSLQIRNTIFKDNQSKYSVLNDGGGANLSIFYGEFSENNVEESVLCNNGKFCVIEKTVFENNIQDNTMNIINKSELHLTDPKIKEKEKSILNQNYILIRKSQLELKNIIYGEGTVEIEDNLIPQGESFDFGYLDKKIHKSNTKEIILDHDITFENYERNFYEGGIELDIDNLIIDGNGKTINGSDKSRIFIITGKNITLKNIIFKNGHSHKNHDNQLNNNGGAIKINHKLHITMENCEFINNTSEGSGGAINNRGMLTISESTFTGNTAQGNGDTGDGGAINNNKAELTISASTLNGNTARYRGGAINNKNGELTIMGSTLTENTASWGGAIYNSYGDLTITDSIFTGNTSEWEGGAIDTSYGELTITGSTVTGNPSINQDFAGEIYYFRAKSFEIKDCKGLQDNCYLP